MKKTMLATLALSLAAGMSPFFAAAQTAADAQEKPAEDKSRPSMPRLFFDSEQRRILEVLRQDIISQDSSEFEEFVPVVFPQERLIDEELDAGIDNASTFQREQDVIRMNAFIRNRKTGDAAFWINGEKFEVADGAGVLRREGLRSVQADEAAGGGAITGVDSVSNARFVLKVGQQLGRDGEVSENYTVVRVKK